MMDSTIATLKAQMGYSEETCRTCNFYVPTDCSGSMSAKNEHCTVANIIDIPVKETGHCKKWAKKVKK